MKHIYYPIIALATVAVAFSSCKKDDPKPPTPEPGDDTVEVTISTANIEVKANVMNEFKGNDRMNIFAKTTRDPKSANIVDNVVATFDGGTWTMSPAVRIGKEQNAFMYAVSPYDPANTDLQKIPVDLSKQIDLLYSGAFVPASFSAPAVKFNMKHALALTTYNIVPVNYSGAGKLQSLAINGEIVKTLGTMDATNGKITVTGSEPFTVKFDRRIEQGGWKADIPGIWAIPFNTKAGDVTFTAVIDGKTYTTLLPEVEMKTGFQYIFRLALTDNGLEFDPSKTETRKLNVDDDEPIDFEGYGRIGLVVKGSNFSIPRLTGDAIFGTIIADGKSSSYSVDYKPQAVSAGSEVVIESWNSTGFTIESLEDIDIIDLSEF